MNDKQRAALKANPGLSWGELEKLTEEAPSEKPKKRMLGKSKGFDRAETSGTHREEG